MFIIYADIQHFTKALTVQESKPSASCADTCTYILRLRSETGRVACGHNEINRSGYFCCMSTLFDLTVAVLNHVLLLKNSDSQMNQVWISRVMILCLLIKVFTIFWILR